MTNYTADQLTQGTDPSACAFAGAPLAGGDSLSFLSNQILASGAMAGGLILPTNANGAGYPLYLKAGDAGTASNTGGTVYLQAGAQVSGSTDGGVTLLDPTGAVMVAFVLTNSEGSVSSANNIISQRNGVNGQTYRIYNTYTDGSNYERMSIAWSSNICVISTNSAGTGTLRGMRLGSSSSVPIGFYGATPVVQPATGGSASTIVNGSGTAGKQDDTYDGYTLAQVVKALRNLGILA